MRHLGRLVFWCGIAALASLPPRNAGAITYSFSRIADSTTEGPNGTLDVNGLGMAAHYSGTTAFQACYGGGDGCAIYTSVGGVLTSVVKDGDAAPTGTFSSSFSLPPPFGPTTFLHRPAISASAVAFKADYQYNELSDSFDRAGIFTSSSGSVSAIAKSGDVAPSGTFTSFSNVALSNTTVAFQAGYGANLQGVFSKNTVGGALTTIAKSGDPAPSLTFTGFSAPANSGSSVAFQGSYDDKQGVFVGTGGGLTAIAKSGDTAPGGFQFDDVGFSEPAMSGTTVAFRATYGDSSGIGIFTGNGGPLSTIVKTGDVAPEGTFLDVRDPSISGNAVAFIGSFAAKQGLFVSSGGIVTPVIKKGDVLFGSSVSSLSLQDYGLDPGGSGNIAFGFSLVNGRAGVALAIAGGPPVGDYNRNGIVDAADYIVWRNSYGDFVAEGDGADANYNGAIDITELFLWRSRFGNSAMAPASGAAIWPASVPEPSTLIIAMCALATAIRQRRGR